MPIQPLGPCLEPGCPERGTYRGRCDAHAKGRDRMLKQQSPRSRKVYGTKRWAALRKQVLIEAGHICTADDCTLLANQVDHIIPIEQGGDPWDKANLRALCQRHHSQVTAAQTFHRK